MSFKQRFESFLDNQLEYLLGWFVRFCEILLLTGAFALAAHRTDHWILWILAALLYLSLFAHILLGLRSLHEPIGAGVGKQEPSGEGHWAIRWTIYIVLALVGLWIASQTGGSIVEVIVDMVQSNAL